MSRWQINVSDLECWNSTFVSFVPEVVNVCVFVCWLHVLPSSFLPFFLSLCVYRNIKRLPTTETEWCLILSGLKTDRRSTSSAATLRVNQGPSRLHSTLYKNCTSIAFSPFEEPFFFFFLPHFKRGAVPLLQVNKTLTLLPSCGTAGVNVTSRVQPH